MSIRPIEPVQPEPVADGNVSPCDSFIQVNEDDNRRVERSGGTLQFVVYGTAVPAGSKRAFVNPKTGRALVVDANSKTKPWQAEVTAAAVEAMSAEAGDGGPLLRDGPLRLEVAFYEPRPKGHYNSKGELNAQGLRSLYPAKKPDVTKLIRAIEDAMTKVVYRDDAQIVATQASKHYGEPARAEVRIDSLSLEGTYGGVRETRRA